MKIDVKAVFPFAWDSSHFNQKHYYKYVQEVPNGGEIRCSGRVSSFCSTSGTRRFYLVTNLVISHEWGQDREVLATSGTYPWSFVTQIFQNGPPSHGGGRKTFEVMTSS